MAAFSFISNGFRHFCNSLQFTLYRDISQKHGQNVGTNHVSAMTAFCIGNHISRSVKQRMSAATPPY
ncbi:hypothetical protein, partial [Bifidobacterium adolescentis]|uniref:hypothetical protein n=1 Tax=Bifidobacterium adolescentis TaxID=1680 RepID=UPI0034A42082